jgi:hypothetical protein
MQWAEAGSLDDFLSARLGYSRSHGSVSQPDGDELPDTRSARIRAFRAAKAAHANQPDTPRRQEGTWKAVHLLGANEVNSLLRDVVDGLAFLVSSTLSINILDHLRYISSMVNPSSTSISNQATFSSHRTKDA